MSSDLDYMMSNMTKGDVESSEVEQIVRRSWC
jgi:hypothetical protein